jgi:ubiquinone/menaquinone biosynthesis C-methylase UbiE
MIKISSKLNIVEKNIKGLWNYEPYVKKYKNEKYTNKNPEFDHMLSRLKTVNKLLKLNVNRGSNILELGFGAGQSSSLFLKEGYKYAGVDISKSLVNFAKLKNIKFVKNKLATFYVGSIDRKLKFKSKQFDAVIIIGALQYIMNLNGCFKEIKRVLKKEGKLIIAQSNSFAIMDIITPRQFLRFLIRIFFKEEFMYSYSTTLKSFILENIRLKKLLGVKGNEKWLNSIFFSSGDYNPWNFKGKRRILGYDRIMHILKKNNFEIITYDFGGVFFYRKKNIFLNIFFKIMNVLLNGLYRLRIFNFILNRIGSSNIFVLKKT